MTGRLEAVLASAETRALAALLSRSVLTAAEVADLDGALQPLRDLQHYGEARSTAAAVLRKGSPYQAQGAHSWLRDLVGAQANDEARQRLELHGRAVFDALRLERRDISTTTLGGLVPPVYLTDAVVASSAPDTGLTGLWRSEVPLPDTGGEVVVGRFSTAGTAGSAAENSIPAESNPATSVGQVPVVLIQSVTDCSVQLLERGGPATDVLVGIEAVAAHDLEVERQVVAGSGTNELTGALNIAGTTGRTYTAVAADASGLAAGIAVLLSATSAARNARPHAVIAHPRRLDVLLAGTRSNELTISDPLPTDPPGTIVRWAGLALLSSSGVPVNLGASTNEDRVLVSRAGAAQLLVGPTSLVASPRSDGSVRLTISRYAALAPSRPSGIGVLSGTGLALTLH